jgi:WD40 repeat protein
LTFIAVAFASAYYFLIFILQDDLIVSGSNDCKIKVWSASTGDCLRTLVGHEALVRALSFDPRSGRLVSASYDKTVKLWDLGSGALKLFDLLYLIP